MSTIEQEIVRLNNSKQDIKDFAYSRGVEIPEETLLNEYREYLDQIPSGSGFDSLPIQILGYNGDSYVNDYRFTDIGNGIHRARVLCSIGGVYCSYGGAHLMTYSCDNPVFVGGDLRISVSSIPVHNIENYNSYSYGDMVEARMNESCILSFYVMDTASAYYIPAHDWYVEIEYDTNQNILLVRAFECDNY